MSILGIACLWIGGGIALTAVGLWLRNLVGSMSVKTKRHHVRGFSVFDLHLIVRGASTRPKREAALYITLKTFPPEPISPAKLLFDEKVRRLGE